MEQYIICQQSYLYHVLISNDRCRTFCVILKTFSVILVTLKLEEWAFMDTYRRIERKEELFLCKMITIKDILLCFSLLGKFPVAIGLYLFYFYLMV